MAQLSVVGFKTGQPLNLGGSNGGLITLSGPGATSPGLQVTHSGSGGGYYYTDSGVGSGNALELYCSYAAGGNAGIYLNYARAGYGIQVAQGDNSAAGVYVGRGGGGVGIQAAHTGSGNGLEVAHSGTGRGISVVTTNTANTSAALYASHNSNTATTPAIWADASNNAYGIVVMKAGAGLGLLVQRSTATTGHNIGTDGTNLQANNAGFMADLTSGTPAGDCAWFAHAGSGRGLYVLHSGTGRGIYLNSSATGGSSEGLYIDKTAGAAGIDVEMGGSTTSIGLVVNTTGTGRAANFTKNNTTGQVVSISQAAAGNASPALFVSHVSNTATVAAIQADASNNAYGIVVSKSGTGIGIMVSKTTANSGHAVGVLGDNIQSGSAGFMGDFSTGTPAGDGVWIAHAGSGRGAHVDHTGSGNAFQVDRTAGAGYGLQITNSGTASGAAVVVDQGGTGQAINVNTSNASNAQTAIVVSHSGTGRGLSISLINGASSANGIYVSSAAAGDAISVSRGSSSLAAYYASCTGTGPGIYISHGGSGPAARLSPSSTGQGVLVANSGTGYGVQINQTNAGGPYALVVNDGSNDRWWVTRTGEINFGGAIGTYVTVGPNSMRSSWNPTTGFQWEDANTSSVLTNAQIYWAGESIACRTVPGFLWIPLEVPDQSVLTEVNFRIYQPVGTTLRFMLMRSDRTVNGGSKSLWLQGTGWRTSQGDHTMWQSGTYGAAALLTGSGLSVTLDRTNYDYWILAYVSAGSSSPYAYVYNSYFYFNWAKVRPR